MAFKIIFSITFTILVIIYTFIPSIKIDSTTIILVLMIFVPWIIKYLKSLELNGVGKVELITKEEKSLIDTKMEEIKFVNTNDIKNKYLNMEDPKLSLASLRIDIEKRLNKIAEKNNINKHHMGITKLANVLYEKTLIDNNEFMILKDITGILNKAVHSKLENYDIQSYNYIIEIGGKLIGSLNNKINKNIKENVIDSIKE